MLKQDVVIDGKVREESSQPLEVGFRLQNDVLMRLEEREVVAVVFALPFFALLCLGNFTVRAILVVFFLVSVLGG